MRMHSIPMAIRILISLVAGLVALICFVFMRSLAFNMLGIVYTPHSTFGIGGHWNKPWADDLNTTLAKLMFPAAGVVVCLVFWLLRPRGQQVEAHDFNGAIAEKHGSPMGAIIIVLILYVVSFILKSVDSDDRSIGRGVLLGWEVFCGVITKLPFSALYLPAWFANFVLGFGLLNLAKGDWPRARSAARFCVAFALSPLLVRMTGPGLMLLMGYYIWLLSMIVFLISVETHWLTPERPK
jgi:hypothetical protein